MSDYIPDLTERYPEGFGGIDTTEPRDLEYEFWKTCEQADRDDMEIPYEEGEPPFEGHEANWYTVSYYTWGGLQEGATVYVPDGEEPSKYIHRYLVKHLGEEYGEINDYMSFKEMMEA